MFQIGMDQLALGAGKRILNKITEWGMKNQFISITPQRMSFSDDILAKHNLKDLSHKDAWDLGEGLSRGEPQAGMAYQDIQRAAALHKGPTQAEILKQAALTSGPQLARQTAKAGEGRWESTDWGDVYANMLGRRKKKDQGLLGPY
jgi:hypothetical protein